MSRAFAKEPGANRTTTACSGRSGIKCQGTCASAPPLLPSVMRHVDVISPFLRGCSVAFGGTSALMIGAAVVASCAGSPEPVVLGKRAATVRVLDSSEIDALTGCASVRGVSATDGAVTPARHPFVGTRERAVQKLQRLAALSGADTIVVDEGSTLATVGLDGARGEEISLAGIAYRCASSAK